MFFTPTQQAADETTPIAQLRELAGQSTALARLVAGNFSADSELLRALAVYDDHVVRQLVTTNPNVPLDLLEKLVKHYPRQVLNNPAIDLFLLEKPNLLTGLSLKDVPVSGLIKRSLVSSKFLEYAAQLSDEKVQMALAMNPHTPKELLEQLMESHNVHVVKAAQMHINWSKVMDANWQLIFQSKKKEVLTKKQEKLRAALKRCTTSKLFYTEGVSAWHHTKEKISLSKGSLVHWGIFLCIWIVLALIFTCYIFLWSSCLIATVMVKITRLIRSITPQKKSAFGISLFSTRSLEMWMQQTQEKLESASVYSDWIYIKDLERIAHHPKVTAEMLEKLMLHKEESVRKKALKNPNLLRFIAEDWSIETLGSFDWGPLHSIAENTNTSTRTLEKLAQSNSRAVQHAAVSNPNANRQVFEWWQKSSGYVDRDLEYFLKDKEEWLKEWAALPTHSRITILMHSKVPIGILAQAFRSDWWLERCAIAQNPSTPRAIRHRLAEDGNWVVRAAARETL